MLLHTLGTSTVMVMFESNLAERKKYTLTQRKIVGWTDRLVTIGPWSVDIYLRWYGTPVDILMWIKVYNTIKILSPF